MKRNHVLFIAIPVIIYALGSCLQFALASTTAILPPSSDGTYLQFATSTASHTHWTLVDETPCNGITDYNYVTSTNSGKRESYGISVTTVGSGAVISQIDIAPCLSRNNITTSNPVGSATASFFYRWNGVDSADYGATSVASSTTPSQLATTSKSGLSLFKTSTSALEIGVLYATGTKGIRLSRMVTRITYTLTTPTAPSSLVATDVSSSQIDLAWADNSTDELGFKIYRALNGGAYSQVATTVSWNATSYSDTGLTADQTYSYEVIAYNAAGTTTSNISTTPSSPFIKL